MGRHAQANETTTLDWPEIAAQAASEEPPHPVELLKGLGLSALLETPIVYSRPPDIHFKGTVEEALASYANPRDGFGGMVLAAAASSPTQESFAQGLATFVSQYQPPAPKTA
jgi:hypothetical protein